MTTRDGEVRARSALGALAGVIAAGVVLGVGELLSVLTRPELVAVLRGRIDDGGPQPGLGSEFAITRSAPTTSPRCSSAMTVLIVVIAATPGIVAPAAVGPAGGAILAGSGWWESPPRPRPAARMLAHADLPGVVAGSVVLLVVLRPVPRTDPSRPRCRDEDAGAGFLVSAVVAAAAGRGRGGRRPRPRALGAGALASAPGDVRAARRGGPGRPDTARHRPRGRRRHPVRHPERRTSTGSTPRCRSPRSTTEDWTLRIHGMVDRELDADLRRPAARDAGRARDHADLRLERGRRRRSPATRAGSASRSRDLLDEAGVQPGADQVLSTSVDGLTVGTPLEALTDGRDALLAVGDERRAAAVRARLPGPAWSCPACTATSRRPSGWSTSRSPRFDRLRGLLDRARLGRQGPIKTVSRIDVPAVVRQVAAGTVAVAGVAWAQHRGIAKVEVRVDEGRGRRPELADVDPIDTWRQWVLDWDATPGSHTAAGAGDRRRRRGADRRAAPSRSRRRHRLALHLVTVT